MYKHHLTHFMNLKSWPFNKISIDNLGNFERWDSRGSIKPFAVVMCDVFFYGRLPVNRGIFLCCQLLDSSVYSRRYPFSRMCCDSEKTCYWDSRANVSRHYSVNHAFEMSLEPRKKINISQISIFTKEQYCISRETQLAHFRDMIPQTRQRDLARVELDNLNCYI